MTIQDHRFDVTLVYDDNKIWLDFSDVTLVYDDSTRSSIMVITNPD